MNKITMPRVQSDAKDRSVTLDEAILAVSRACSQGSAEKRADARCRLLEGLLNSARVNLDEKAVERADSSFGELMAAVYGD